MNIEEYLNVKKEIQQEILRLLSSDETIDDLSFDNFTKIIEDQKIREDENEFRSFLHLVDSIAKNHHRSSSFFYVIDNIILMFKNEFAKYLSNSEIFNIFYLNKRIILTLLKNNILVMTPYISNYIKAYMDENSIIYFFNEMKPFFKEKENELKNKLEQEMKRIDPDEYEKNRNIGENEKMLCQFIRNDSIDDFIIYVNKTNLSLNTKIESSIFETNLYLNEKEVSLIEYSLFYGSIQIFNYLRLNKVKLESSLWNFVIHGRNPELIHLLEENNVKPPFKSYDKCFIESIKCHHNEIAEYFQNKYFKDDEEIYKNEEIKSQIINSCNYKYFPNNFIDKNSFFDLCRCDHFFLVKKMLENKDFSEVDFIRQIYNEEDNENQILTPFFAAINNDNTNIIELLIKRPEIDLNFQCTFYTWLSHEFNYNTLCRTVMFDNAKIFKLLLNNKNFDANAVSKERKYQSQYNCSLEEFCPLVESIHNQNLEILKILLSNEKVNVNIQLKYMDTQNDKIISLINEITPLYEAVLTENLEIIKLLLEHPKIDVNLKLLYNSENNQINEALLCYSICKCKNEITKLLLAHPKIDVNSTRIIKNDEEVHQEKSALFLAIENENEEIVQCLLKNENIDVNAKIYHKESYITALHFAFKLKNEAIIKDLLSHPKIDINLKSFKKHTQANIMTSKEKTTLNYALKNQNIDIIKLMLSKHEINLNLKYRKLFYSEFSFTCIEKDPLEIAIHHNNIIIFQLLFDYFLMRNKLSVDYLKKLYDISLDEIKELISKHL